MSTLANESTDLIRPLTELPPLEAVAPTRQLLDTAVKETRAKAPSAAAEGRRVDRLSVDEMNDLSLDDIRERFIKSSTDTRGPMETVLDWIDAPRNLIMSSLAPGLRRRAEERGEKGTFGLGRVHASDVLEEMGIEQPIVRGVLGFIGDVAFDPLTYIGPPAKGAQLAAKGAQGATSAYTLTKTGRNALLRGIDEVAKTGQSADAEIGKYLALASAERGLKPGTDTKDLLASHVLGELYTPTLREAGAEAVQGRPLAAVGKAYDATVEQLLRPVGGSVEFTGSALARDIERVDEVGDAARDVLRKYGEYLSEPGLRIGVKPGQAATRVAHIPFTDVSLSVPQFMPNAHALKTQAVANAVRDGSIDAARLLPQSAQVLLRNEQIAGNVGEQMDAAEAYLRERAALEAMSDDDFMPPPSGQGPSTPTPAPGGPPSPAPVLPGGGAATPQTVRSPEQIASDLRLKSQAENAKNQSAGATFPSERGAGNAVNVKGAAGAAEPSAAASRAMGRIDSQPLPPIKTREQLINELHTAFSDVPKQARDDFIKLVDARVRKLKVLPDDYWAKKFAEFRKGLPEGGRTLEQGPLYQAFTHHGTPWVFERLYQRGKGGKRGAITFLEDRRAVLSALENPNESTLIHELGHSFRQELVGDDLLAVERHYKIKPGSKWSRPMEERYARDFERYLATGKAPTRELAGVFERFKEWLQRIYIQIVGTPLEQKLTPTMRKHFDSLFKADDGVDATTVVKPALREGAIIGSKTAVVDRIESLMPFNTEELVESWFTQANRIMNGGFEAGEQGSIEQLSTGFAKLPREVKEWLDGLPYPQEAKIRGMFKEGSGAKGGEDAMATLDSLGMGRYFDAIELLYGSPALRAKVLLKYSPPSAERDFYESLLESFMGGRAGGREAVTFTDLDVGSTFTINGHPGIIVEDELGRKFLRHPNGDDVSAESLGRFAIDRGTLSVLNQSDAAHVADEINPNPHAKYGSEFGDAPAFADDGGPGDLPFSPGPFFQGGDIPNQSGLFGQGNVGPSGEKQGGLFGDMSKQPEPPQIDPMARREGESIEDWRIRTKFAKAERNTGTLFQDDGDALFPKDKALKDLDDQYRMQSAAIVQAARQSFEEVEAIVKGMDAASYAQSPQTIEAALQLRQKYEEASVTYRRAQAVAETTQNLARQLKIVGDKDKETILRELAPLGDDLADRIYEIASTDPEAASKIADMAQLSMSTAALNAEMLRSQFIKFASAPDRALSAYAMNVLGTDNRQLARTAFRTMADAARRMGVSNDGRLIGLLNQMDETSRRVFGIRGGYVQKELADIGAEARGVYNESLRWQHTLESRVRDAVGEKLPPDQFDQALRIVYGIMHELVDPGQSGFNWFRKTAEGPQGLSAMAELLQKAKSDGVFAKAYPKLREVAMQSVSDIRQLGDSEIGDQILDYLMTNHVPIVPTDEGGRAMLEMNLARNATSGGKGQGVQPFQMRRTTHQRYFQGPDGKWRWYYGFDEHLPKLRSQLFDADGSPLPTSVVARELDVPEDVAAQYQQAVEAQDVWAQMVADNPGVEKDFPWKPTDAYELNELFHRGRMRALVGSSKDPKDMFDTRASIVQGARMAMHQRAVSQKKLANIVDRNLLAFPSKDKLFESAKEVGRVVKTKTGVDAKVVGLENSSLGGFVPVFEIGGERYRALDPKVRSGFIGRLLPEMADRGIMRSDVADLVEKVADLTRGDNVWPIIRFADHLQGLWKKTTLFNPSWTVNDTLGNITLAISGGAHVRDMTKHAPAVYRLRSLLHSPDKAASMTIKLGDGRTVNGLDLLHILVQKRIFENTLPAEVAAKLVQENPSILSKPQSYLDSVFGWNLRFNSFTQDQMRGMAFMSHLEQGADVESAALKTIQSMMDWSDFTRVEQQVFRRLMPFYSWMRNNLGYQLYLLLNDPKWAAAVPKLKESLEQSFAGDAVVPEQERPGWMREALATQLSSNPEKRFGMMFAQALPAGDLFQFMLPLVGTEGAMKFAHAMGSSVSPLLKVPLEVGAGEEFFSGRTIGADAYSADLSIGEYATNQIAPLNTVRKTGEAFGRSGAEAAARLAFGGRIQAMDDARLASSLERQDRDKERRLRGAITRAERRGDADTVAEARARLLRLYQNRMDRGAKVPDWAVGALQEMNAAE